jgi:hypothetical protein
MQLARWMLEHGQPEALEFLSQLDHAEITPWRCECGCASLDFSIPGRPQPNTGICDLGHFIFGTDANPNGIFIYEQSGTLSGVEVYGFAGDAPKTLPKLEELRPFGSKTKNATG